MKTLGIEELTRHIYEGIRDGIATFDGTYYSLPRNETYTEVHSSSTIMIQDHYTKQTFGTVFCAEDDTEKPVFLIDPGKDLKQMLHTTPENLSAIVDNTQTKSTTGVYPRGKGATNLPRSLGVRLSKTLRRGGRKPLQ